MEEAADDGVVAVVVVAVAIAAVRSLERRSCRRFVVAMFS